MKKLDFNVLKFLAIFFLLLQAFYMYVGITTKDGRLFSPFLNKYANFPDWFTIAISTATKFILQLAGYNVYQSNSQNITIYGTRGVTLAWGCLGMAAITLWVGFVFAHRQTLKFKLKWTAAGIIGISIVNVMRVIMIILSEYYNWSYFKHFNAHSSFNIITYIVILGFMYVFVRHYNTFKSKSKPAAPNIKTKAKLLEKYRS